MTHRLHSITHRLQTMTHRLHSMTHRVLIMTLWVRTMTLWVRTMTHTLSVCHTNTIFNTNPLSLTFSPYHFLIFSPFFTLSLFLNLTKMSYPNTKPQEPHMVKLESRASPELGFSNSVPTDAINGNTMRPFSSLNHLSKSPYASYPWQHYHQMEAMNYLNSGIISLLTMLQYWSYTRGRR